jgi:hypothetical protein
MVEKALASTCDAGHYPGISDVLKVLKSIVQRDLTEAKVVSVNRPSLSTEPLIFYFQI